MRCCTKPLFIRDWLYGNDISGGGLNPATQAFIAINGMTDPAEINVLNDYINELEGYGLLDASIFDYIQPCIGYAGLTAAQRRTAMSCSIINPSNPKKLSYIGVPATTKEGIDWQGAYASTQYAIGDLTDNHDVSFGSVQSGLTNTFTQLNVGIGNIRGFWNSYNGAGKLYVAWGDAVFGTNFLSVDSTQDFVNDKLLSMTVEPVDATDSNVYTVVDGSKSASLGLASLMTFPGYLSQVLGVGENNSSGIVTKMRYQTKRALTNTEMTNLNTATNNFITAKAAL